MSIACLPPPRFVNALPKSLEGLAATTHINDISIHLNSLKNNQIRQIQLDIQTSFFNKPSRTELANSNVVLPQVVTLTPDDWNRTDKNGGPYFQFVMERTDGTKTDVVFGSPIDFERSLQAVPTQVLITDNDGNTKSMMTGMPEFEESERFRSLIDAANAAANDN